MKKVLIIAYHFSPDAEVGGMRGQKFAKYLPLYGWEPLILSVDEKYYPLRDPVRNNSINCEVFRTKVFWSLREVYLKIKVLSQSISRGSLLAWGCFESVRWGGPHVVDPSTGFLRPFGPSYA